MTALSAFEVFALLALSVVLISVGLLLVLLGSVARRDEGAVRSRGLVVLLLGPVPIVLKGSTRTVLVALAFAVALLLLLFLIL